MPAWELAQWAQYLSKVGTPEERIEAYLLQLATLHANANRDPKKHPNPFAMSELCLFKDPWEVKELVDQLSGRDRYTELDREIMALLMSS